MTGKSAKQRRQRNGRGRPRDGSTARTPSGRKSRARQPKEDPRLVVLEARRRVLGLPENLVSHEKAGTVLGRLWLAGEIGDRLLEAGERYLEIYREAMRAIKAPTGLAVSSAAGGAGDQVSEDYVVWAMSAVSRYRVMRVALEAAGACRVVHAVVCEDAPVSTANLERLTAGLKILAGKLGLE
jgi:hypothetical protein